MFGSNSAQFASNTALRKSVNNNELRGNIRVNENIREYMATTPGISPFRQHLKYTCTFPSPQVQHSPPSFNQKINLPDNLKSKEHNKTSHIIPSNNSIAKGRVMEMNKKSLKFGKYTCICVFFFFSIIITATLSRCRLKF